MKTLKKANASLIALIVVLSGLFATSCGDGSDGRNPVIPGVKGPTVTLFEDNVLISLVVENLDLGGGLRYNIPKYEKSYIEVSPDLQSNGTLFAASISLDDVFGGNLDDLDPQTLPGGRPLPGILGGRLPAVAFSIPSFHNLAFYIGNDVYGVFVPVNIPVEDAVVPFRFYSSGSKVGTVSIVGKDSNGENSGVLLLLDMKGNTKKRLKRLSEKY